jgi:hypothetical protein
VPLVALDDLGGGFLIGPDHFAEVFRIKFTREISGADEIAEHHGELATFGL